MSAFYKLQVASIHRESPSAISVVFTIPNELKPVYQFVSGQYVTLKLTLNGEEIRRAYSICSSPNSGELRIAIKAIQNGSFSVFANQNLQTGDLIEVSIPEGKFTFEPDFDRQRNYAAFTAGSGITPIISILKSVLENEPKSSFVLVYGNKNPEETIFYNELIGLQQKYLGRLFVHFIFSQVTNGEFFGRIDKKLVHTILTEKHIEKEFSKFYLCGPEAMINTVAETLKEHNVLEKNIKFELFFASKTTETTVDTTTSGHTKITILLDGEETAFEMSQKQTLLEAALKQGVEAPYSCQGGVCSSCLARISKGSATMKKNSILTDNEIADGLILTCQAHPTSNEIFVDFDDV